jgi:hypothetical protein
VWGMPAVSSDVRQRPSRRSFAATSYTVGSLLFGVWLFRLSEEGIGLTQRLTAAGRVRLPAIRMLTLESERLKNELVTTSKNWGASVPQSFSLEGHFGLPAWASSRQVISLMFC